MNNYLDPSACVEVVSVVTEKMAAAGAYSKTLSNANKIDLGRYEYVMVLASCGDVGVGATVTFTLFESDTRTSTDFPLDGTNGAPNYTMSVTTGGFGTGWASFPTAGRRRYLKISVATSGGSGNGAGSVLVLGFMRSSEAVLRPFARTGVAQVGLT